MERKHIKYYIFAFIIILFVYMANSDKNVEVNNNVQNTTKASESRYNDMDPADYYKEMKSDNLEYSDIAWHAQNTYGWNCSEVISLGQEIQTDGKELKDPALISEITGTYSIATCSSGEKLRVYPRYNTYPIITNINGGFE